MAKDAKPKDALTMIKENEYTKKKKEKREKKNTRECSEREEKDPGEAMSV